MQFKSLFSQSSWMYATIYTCKNTFKTFDVNHKIGNLLNYTDNFWFKAKYNYKEV